MVEAEVEVEIEVLPDITFSVRDSIDRDQVPIGSARVKATTNRTFNVLLTFEGGLAADAQLTDAEVWAQGKNRYITVDFGEVNRDCSSRMTAADAAAHAREPMSPTSLKQPEVSCR